MSLAATEPDRWRLESDCGDHHWRYLSKEESSRRPQSTAEKLFLGLETNASVLKQPDSFQDAAVNGWLFYQDLQLADGHWACDYGGPSFLLPGLVFAMYITDTEIPEEWTIEMTRYLENIVNDDGGWGLHLAGGSTVFATGLYYVMLRLLGLEKEHPLARNARRCLLSLGGATGIPQWGKIWLACLNLYNWDGINPVPAEFWILPDWLPFHPWRWWVQCRVVYLPASYLWSNKCSKELDPLLASLRDEIFVEPFSAIDFSHHRYTIAPTDANKPPSILLLFINLILVFWTQYLRPNWLLKKANRRISSLIRREDENTSYNCLAPVNKAFHMVAVWFLDGPDSSRLRLHRERIHPYLWQSEKGMTCSGTNGVQLWDTAFSIQAAVDAGFGQDKRFHSSLAQALEFLEMSQLRKDLDDPYRQPRRGGWPFSTKSNGYIVSDCAAEAMKAVLLLQEECSFPKIISDHRLFQCVDSLLLMQNPDGGFGSYERARGSELLEHLNPADVFDRIMVEYSYPECTTAVLTSLALFKTHFPSYRPAAISTTISLAAKYIKAARRPDGSWYGSWAICFTYATFFALQSLEAIGETWQSSDDVKRSCAWLLSKQKEDGGWGEHFSSCELREYVEHPESQVVNTSWAVLALMHARYPDPRPIERGLELIKSRQQANGEWLQEDIEGIFNCTTTICYPNYKYYFTTWALGRYSHIYLPQITDMKRTTF